MQHLIQMALLWVSLVLGQEQNFQQDVNFTNLGSPSQHTNQLLEISHIVLIQLLLSIVFNRFLFPKVVLLLMMIAIILYWWIFLIWLLLKCKQRTPFTYLIVLFFYLRLQVHVFAKIIWQQNLGGGSG